jgi:cathepsin B
MVLSTALQATINLRPTNTHLRSQKSENESGYIELLKSSEIMDPNIKIPDNFDGRKVWGNLLSIPQNQGTCGSCWAFASVGTLGDKFNIQSMGLINIQLSAAKLIICDFKGKETDIRHPEQDPDGLAQLQDSSNKTSACFGNTLADAWRYLFIIGTNTETCVPYNKKYGAFKELDALGSFTSPERMPVCSQVTGLLGDMCAGFTYNHLNSEETGNPARFFRNLHYYAIAGVSKDGGTELNIRYNIYRWGPVSTSFSVFPSFYTYDSKNEIYERNDDETQVGGHAVEIVGWGEENNVKYWIIKNSWGTEWGSGGYFRMVRGSNNCEIEENVITGVPDFFYPLTYSLTRSSDFNGIKWSEPLKAINKRRSIITGLNQPGGGIDPTTGYTRRVMATMSWVDFSSPIKIEDLPKYYDSKWIAGVDASLEKRTLYQNSINSNNKDVKYESMNTVIIILSILICLLIIAGIVYFIRKNN